MPPVPAMPPVLSSQEVCVDAPARLHLGFLDVGGELGRRFGSLGLTIAAPRVRLRARRAPTADASGAQAARAAAYLKQCLDLLGLEERAHLSVDAAIPAHAGLGSGTQLALAVVAALCRLFELDEDRALTAVRLARGRRSGIGLASFEHGGLVVDGGHGTHSLSPPVITRQVFPSAWRIVLLLDSGRQGLSGSREAQAFQDLDPMSAEVSGQICRNVLLRVLPGVREGDFDAFAAGIGTVQECVGGYFAPAQDGRPFTSERVAEVAEWARRQGFQGIGQSSWGPTGFVFTPDTASAERLAEEIDARWGSEPDLVVQVTGAANEGAHLHGGPVGHTLRGGALRT